MAKNQHIQSRKSVERQRLEQIVIGKYMAIWGHERIQSIIDFHSRIDSLVAALDEKKICYEKDLRAAVKFSPLENADLSLAPEAFEKMISEVNLQRLRRISEDFDIIFMWVDDGHCSRNLHDFIASKSYALASYGKPKFVYGYDPDFCNGRISTGRRSKHGIADGE